MSKINASDIGIWRTSATGLFWSWLPIRADEIVLTDKRVQGSQVRNYVRSTFRLGITESSAIYEDGYRVTTCGSSGKGATRHHEFKTMVEAQAYALKWLDYRFGVELVSVDAEVAA